MATVARRTVQSSPHRDSGETWGVIVEILSGSSNENAKAELQSVAGIAASIIAERTPKSSPIIVTCDGPRTRIYCTYDDDAIDGSGANENSLGYDPLQGNWKISLPCASDDLDWVVAALEEKSDRISARDESEGLVVAEDSSQTEKSSLLLDTEGFANL